MPIDRKSSIGYVRIWPQCRLDW